MLNVIRCSIDFECLLGFALLWDFRNRFAFYGEWDAFMLSGVMLPLRSLLCPMFHGRSRLLFEFDFELCIHTNICWLFRWSPFHLLIILDSEKRWEPASLWFSEPDNLLIVHEEYHGPFNLIFIFNLISVCELPRFNFIVKKYFSDFLRIFR